MSLFIYFKRIIKNISVLILILSLIFYSPFSRSAVPAIFPAVKTIAQVLVTSVGGAYLYKFIKKYSDSASDYFFDDDGDLIIIMNGNYCNKSIPACVSNLSQAEIVSEPYLKKHFTHDSYEFIGCRYDSSNMIFCSLSSSHKALANSDGSPDIRSVALVCTENCSQKKVALADVVNSVIDDYKKGDEDAKRIIDEAKKRDGIDDSDDDGTGTKKGDDSDDSSGTGKKDGDDSDDSSGTGKKDGDDSDDGSGASDDLTCDSTKFHKKVCDFIDWTYDTYDVTHDKIKEYFEEEDIEKDSLKDLVKEEEVIMRKSDFDLADSCPAPKYVNTSFLGKSVSIQVFNFEGVCKWASFIEYALQTTSLIIAFNIIAGRREV